MSGISSFASLLTGWPPRYLRWETKAPGRCRAASPTVIEPDREIPTEETATMSGNDVELFELQLKLRQAGVVSSWLY